MALIDNTRRSGFDYRSQRVLEDVMAEQANFKRINFFEGFFTTGEDWNAAEAYHLEKRRLHNRVLHTPGVVPVVGGGLRVMARGRGDLSLEVAPGYATHA